MMTKAVFTTKPSGSYDDAPEVRYHFPRTYLAAVERTVGDLIVYYEPRRDSAEAFSRAGRQAYFAVARVTDVTADPTNNDLFYAAVADFLSFDTPVPFRAATRTWERALTRHDGGVSKGAFGRSVRPIAEDEFDAILAAGFTVDPWEVADRATPPTMGSRSPRPSSPARWSNRPVCVRSATSPFAAPSAAPTGPAAP